MQLEEAGTSVSSATIASSDFEGDNDEDDVTSSSTDRVWGRGGYRVIDATNDGTTESPAVRRARLAFNQAVLYDEPIDVEKAEVLEEPEKARKARVALRRAQEELRKVTAVKKADWALMKARAQQRRERKKVEEAAQAEQRAREGRPPKRTRMSADKSVILSGAAQGGEMEPEGAGGRVVRQRRH